MQQDAQQEKFEKEARAAQQRRAKIISANAEIERKREAARQDERQKILADRKADKIRDQIFEDKLRAIEVQKKKLELEKEMARVKRENDFIDQELKAKSAQTDVIQSEADANRNLSIGGNDLMQSEGKAREKKASRWFN